MSISRIIYKKEKPGLRYDSEKKGWIGYRIDIVVRGRRDRTGGFSTKKKAQEYIESLKERDKFDRKGLKYAEGLSIPRVSELFERRLRQLNDRRERIRGERIFKYFVDLLEYDLRVTEIRSFHFQIFVNTRLGDGVQARTVNREFTLLSKAFNIASQIFPKELEDYTPPKMKRASVPRTRKKNRVVTEKEKDDICVYLYSPLDDVSEKVNENRIRIGRMFECAWFLGLRFSEVARLQKSDLKESEASLRVVRWKTDDITMFEYLPAPVIDLLNIAAKSSDTDFIFTHSGSYPKDFYKILKEAVEAAGLVYGRSEMDGITFHRARHSFITRLVQVTDIATAASFSGHSDGAMVAHYSHASAESRRQAMEKLYGDKIDRDRVKIFYDKVKRGAVDFEEFLDVVANHKF